MQLTEPAQIGLANFFAPFLPRQLLKLFPNVPELSVTATFKLGNNLKRCSQVIPERVEHVANLPQKVEMFYDPTGKEAHIQPIGEEYGVVVYNHDLKADSNFFTRSILEENFMKKKKVERGPIPKDIQDDSLVFESRFESGNLAKATRITDNYYELRLRPDLFTSRHCQWFYFRVQNMRADMEYRFSFVNFLKPDSQYCVGMKPVLYSEKEVALTGVSVSQSLL